MSDSTAHTPHILLVNDDGIGAEGLAVLADALAGLGELTIVAPAAERSGSGHAITVLADMPLTQVERNGAPFGWSLDGSPADCVKVAVQLLNRGKPYDLCVSGINRGVNTGRLVMYSGTAAGAREASMHAIPSIALSSFYTDETCVRYKTAGRVGRKIAGAVLAEGLPRGIMLNVNVPDVEYDAIEGWSITRMGFSTYADLFEHDGQEGGPHPSSVRNIGSGWEASNPPHPDFDDHALAANRVTITPMHYDLTAFEVIPRLQHWEK